MHSSQIGTIYSDISEHTSHPTQNEIIKHFTNWEMALPLWKKKNEISHPLLKKYRLPAASLFSCFLPILHSSFVASTLEIPAKWLVMVT